MNDLEIPRRRQMLADARSKLAEIERAPVSSEKEAAKAAALIVGSYPQSKAANPEVYMRQLRALLTGIPLAALFALIDPKRGILGRCSFLPTMAEVRAWIEEYEAPRRSLARALRAEIETLGAIEPPRPDDAERERRRQVAASIGEQPKAPNLGHLEWLKPEAEQSAKERAERTRLAACQAKDHTELAKTWLVRAPVTEAERACKGAK